MTNVVTISWPKNTQDLKDESPEFWVVDSKTNTVRRADPDIEVLKSFLTADITNKPLDATHLVHSDDVTPGDIADYLGVRPDDMTVRFVNIQDLYKATHLPTLAARDGSRLSAEHSLFKRKLIEAKNRSVQTKHELSIINDMDVKQLLNDEQTQGKKIVVDFLNERTKKDNEFLKSVSPGEFQKNYTDGKILAMGYLSLKEHFEAPFAYGNQNDNPGTKAFHRACLISDQIARMQHNEPCLHLDQDKVIDLELSLKQDFRQKHLNFQKISSSDPLVENHTKNHHHKLINANVQFILDNPDLISISYPIAFKDSLLAAYGSQGESLVNPRWFDDLTQKTGQAANIEKLTSHKSKETLFLKQYTLADDASEYEKNRLSYVQSLLELRSAYNAYTYPMQNLVKLKALAQEHEGGIPIPINAYGAITGRHTPLDTFKINFQGLTANAKECIVPKDGYVAMDFDGQQLEVRTAADVLGIKTIQQMVQKNVDIYSGMVAKKELSARHASDEQKAKEIRYILDDPHTHDPTLVQDIEEKRKQSKVLIISSLYGQGAGGLSAKTGWSVEESRAYINEFKKDFPEIAQTHERVDDFLKQGLENKEAQMSLGTPGNVIQILIRPTDKPSIKPVDLLQDSKEANFALEFHENFVKPNLAPPSGPLELVVVYDTGDQMIYPDIQLKEGGFGNSTTITYDKDGERVDLFASRLVQNIIQSRADQEMKIVHEQLALKSHENNLEVQITLPTHDSLRAVLPDPKSDKQNANNFEQFEQFVKNPQESLGTKPFLSFDIEIIEYERKKEQDLALSYKEQDLSLFYIGTEDLSGMSFGDLTVDNVDLGMKLGEDLAISKKPHHETSLDMGVGF
ncbi:DNA polymerase [Moraxella nasovis]|uniref:DNA polymerase n=1 Tax=Moraxella nasovis TaxID=2904121 RepID=UPI001F60E9CD|nr:DNA polymerase [Moraxella nasovis]UNU73384.1 DNA polymerase [Moraxella nasovis]